MTVNNRGTRNAQLVQLPAVPMTTLNLMRPAGTRVQIEVSEDLVYWSPLYSVVSPANHRIEIVDRPPPPCQNASTACGRRIKRPGLPG